MVKSARPWVAPLVRPPGVVKSARPGVAPSLWRPPEVVSSARPGAASSSRPLRCGLLRLAVRAGVDVSPVAGCPSATRWVELPPVGWVLPSMPLQRGDQQRSAAATQAGGGRCCREVARLRQRTHILLGARLSTKRSAMMNVRRRAQEYGGEKGAVRDGFFRSCLGPVASPTSCPQPLRRIGLWLAEPVRPWGRV